MYNIHILPYGRGVVPDMIFSNRRRLCAILLVFPIASICARFQHARAKNVVRDPFWQKAVAIAQANKGWVPGHAVLRIEIIDKHGKVEQSKETLLDFMSTDTGEAPLSPYVDPSSLDIVGKSPFEPEFQEEISAYSTGETKNVEGKQCIRYEYVWHREDEVLTGTAWLEQETGIPVKTEFSANAPAKTEFSRGQHVTVVFRSESYDAWFPEKMTMEIRGGLLAFGRSFRITLDYGNYRIA
jgi:hypothetical protein